MEKRIMHIISGMLLVVALLSMTGCGKVDMRRVGEQIPVRMRDADIFRILYESEMDRVFCL